MTRGHIETIKNHLIKTLRTFSHYGEPDVQTVAESFERMIECIADCPDIWKLWASAQKLGLEPDRLLRDAVEKELKRRTEDENQIG
jgi:hypothetical protein